eukprot:Rmarinus@m.12662
MSLLRFPVRTVTARYYSRALAGIIRYPSVTSRLVSPVPQSRRDFSVLTSLTGAVVSSFKSWFGNNMTFDSEDVLKFWFGVDLDHPQPRSLWFMKSDQFDAEIRARYEDVVNAALSGEIEEPTDPAATLAMIILVDQFTRNLYRNTPKMLAGDEKALKLSRKLVASGEDKLFPPVMRCFVYTPYEHSESLQAQEECVALTEQLVRDFPVDGAQTDSDRKAREFVAQFARYAVQHREPIKRFNRFPHRNAMLGRKSTPEEEAYLEEHGGF